VNVHRTIDALTLPISTAALFRTQQHHSAGIQQSGLGREGGQYGLHEFSEMKYIATQWWTVRLCPIVVLSTIAASGACLPKAARAIDGGARASKRKLESTKKG